MIRDLTRDFAEKEVRPIAEAIDREARFPRETVSRMAELGLMGVAVPEAHGGAGGDTVGYALAVEELARACASHAVIMSVNNSLYCDPVCKHGTRASDTAELLFERCRVPAAQRLGEVGQGFKIALGTLDAGRIGIAAQAVGIAVAAYEAAVVYARERKSFGVPIGQHQMVQWMLADMATAIEAARLLTLRAAWRKDAGAPYGPEAAMAKLFAAETAMRVTTDAIQVHGGYRFIKE